MKRLMFISLVFLVYFFPRSTFAKNSEKESDHLPFGSSTKLCMQSFENGVIPQISKGDLMILRVDASHLLYDQKFKSYDLNYLKQPYNYFQPHFNPSNDIKLLSQRSRIYGSENDKMEYLYFFKAIKTGKNEFTTARNYRVITGQHELGTEELLFLNLMINFKNLLLENGSDTPSFESYMNEQMPKSAPITKTIFAEMSNSEESKPFEERLRLAEKRIVEWRNSLSPPIYSNHQVHGNHTPFEITESVRSGVITTQIHQLRYHHLPTKLTVNIGDLIVVESIRPDAVITWNGDEGYPPGAYAHRFSAPEIQGLGLHLLYTETLERALLPNDHGSNILKFYFLVENMGPASILIGKPKISHPFTTNQKDTWEKKIEIKVLPTPHLKNLDYSTSSTNSLPPPYLRELSELDQSKLYPGSPLSKNDVKAISKYYTDLVQSKHPSRTNEDTLIEVLRPFFGESRNERLFFLTKKSGLEANEIDFAKAKINFNASNAVFFKKLIEVLRPETGIARILHKLIEHEL